MKTLSPQDSLEKLDQSIRRAHLLIQIFSLITLLCYGIWFWFIKMLPLADSSETWGTFGDFFGGILNPVVAYAAFYWLTQSVRLQKQELSETRLALQDTATSQAKTAIQAQMSVRLSALAALTNSITAEISTLRLEMQFISDQLARDPDKGVRTIEGTWLKPGSWDEYLREKNARVTQRLADHASIEFEVRDLLHQHQTNTLN